MGAGRRRRGEGEVKGEKEKKETNGFVLRSGLSDFLPLLLLLLLQSQLIFSRNGKLLPQDRPAESNRLSLPANGVYVLEDLEGVDLGVGVVELGG